MACTERGLLTARGRQRTDATHVLGALRVLSRLEACRNVTGGVGGPRRRGAGVGADPRVRRLARTLRAAHRGHRLPKGQVQRQAFAATVGADGLALLAALEAADDTSAAPPAAGGGTAPARVGATIRRSTGQVRLGEAQDLPPVAEQIETPHEPDAATEPSAVTSWVGYKVHLTETCDDERPHLVTHVATTLAPEADVEHLAPIQEELERKTLTPAQHLVDGGYVRGSNLVSSRDRHGIDLVGPVVRRPPVAGQDRHRLRRAAQFAIDWDGAES